MRQGCGQAATVIFPTDSASARVLFGNLRIIIACYIYNLAPQANPILNAFDMRNGRMGVYHDILARLKAERQGSQDLDIALGCAIGLYQPCSYLAGWLVSAETGGLIQEQSCHKYTRSLDDAVTLYPIKPEHIASDPLRVCIDALEARLEQAALLL